jgi:hypothetical protein
MDSPATINAIFQEFANRFISDILVRLISRRE